MRVVELGDLSSDPLRSPKAKQPSEEECSRLRRGEWTTIWDGNFYGLGASKRLASTVKFLFVIIAMISIFLGHGYNLLVDLWPAKVFIV